jgi:hypothetical protein
LNSTRFIVVYVFVAIEIDSRRRFSSMIDTPRSQLNRSTD